MKVVLFTESLPPNTDGVVKTLTKLAYSLQNEGIDYHFFSAVQPEQEEPWRDRVTKVKSAPLGMYKYYHIGLPFFENISKQLKFFQPDIVHITTPSFLGLYGLNYAHRNRLPVVASYHTHFVDYFSYFGLSWLEPTGWAYLKWFHNQCDMTFAPSPSAMRELQSRGIQNVDLWQRGIELDRFSPNLRDNALRRQIGAEDKKILLFVGRLINHKDLDDLVAANRILKSRGNDFKLVILGDGPMMPELRQQLPEAYLPGFVYGDELARWYASADIFTFPSTTETFGNVILESFASGTPAIGATAGGVADIINDGIDGLLAQPKNPFDFADKIETLLKNPALIQQMGKRARETAAKYKWSTINRRLITSYRQLIESYHEKTVKRRVAA